MIKFCPECGYKQEHTNKFCTGCGFELVLTKSEMLIQEAEKVECPRCLGKGNVDNDDINRLGRQTEWIAGPCAFCSNTGMVEIKFINNNKVDDASISIDNPFCFQIHQLVNFRSEITADNLPYQIVEIINGDLLFFRLSHENGTIVDKLFTNEELIGFNGVGKVFYENRTLKYHGEFSNGLFNGNGKLFFEDGDIKYDGGWNNGKREGYGTAYGDESDFTRNEIRHEENIEGFDY